MTQQTHAQQAAQDTSVSSARQLIQPHRFQAEVNTHLQTPQIQEKPDIQSGWDLTQKQVGFSGQPLHTTPGQPLLQAKLTIGEPNDKYEQEADRVAHDVVQRIHHTNGATATDHPLEQPGNPVKRQETLQREVATEEEDELQRKPLVQRMRAESSTASTEVEQEINQARGSGQPLAPKLQTQIGQAMGADFTGVRIHTDARADQLNRSVGARAFTTGQDLFFRNGEYNPGSRGGQELIAHELTHVVQQNGAMVRRSPFFPPLLSQHSTTKVPSTPDGDRALQAERNLKQIQATAIQRDVDTSSSPFLPTYGNDEVPAWQDDGGVPEWAKEEYKKDAKRTVICSMTPDGKIGSVYFGDQGRIRTTHGAGPAKESHSKLKTVQFNIDEQQALAVFQSVDPKGYASDNMWELFDEWLAGTLNRATKVDQLPGWIKLVDSPETAYDIKNGNPPEDLKLFEIFTSINGRLEGWHPSRGTAAKFETDKQVISVLEAAIKHIDKMRLKNPKQRNIQFYDFIKTRLPNFVPYIRRPDEIET